HWLLFLLQWYCWKTVKPNMNQDIKDRAAGCLLGALCGDAAGATLEFLDHDPTETEAALAMNMPGGGELEVAPGQITDDGELTLCLAQSLTSSKCFDLEAVARGYYKWIESRPFDIGFTTSFSLGAPKNRDMTDQSYANTMIEEAAKLCVTSKANGSLMRITPLGVWGHNLPTEQLTDFAITDTSLSHPNHSCRYAVASYTIAIATLVNKGDRQLAFNNARNWLDSQANLAKDPEQYKSWAEVSSWLYDAADNIDVAYFPQAGFVKIAFTHAFRHLILGSDYESAIAETLRGGGDTDTNACIVGGLIGAAVGEKKIPEAMKNAVLNCDTSEGKHFRPSFLHPQQVPKLIDSLLNI
ncbi:MAG: ADP-ribosylglycohydrolase family protein, partial [Cyanobacteria bacterium J06600_6]